MLQNESYVTKAAAGKGDVCCVDSFRQELVGSQSRVLLGEVFCSGESESGIEGKGQGCRLMVLALAHCLQHTHLSWR